MEKQRRKRRNTRITFLHLLPLILLGLVFVSLVARKGFSRFVPQVNVSGLVETADRALKHVGTPEIVAVGVAMLVYIYLLPGNAWRLEKLIKPDKVSRRRRIPSLHGQMEAWQPKLTPEMAASQGAEQEARINTTEPERVG